MVVARRKCRRRSSGGFTLIELMIAMALSTVGLLGLVALQTIAIRGNMMSRNFGEALGLAQQRLESVEQTPYASLTTVFGTEPCPPPTTSIYCTGGTTQLSPDPSSTIENIYSRCTNVTIDAVTNVTTVLVRTCWQDTSAGWHKVEINNERSP